jgi:hypothetical protein
MAALVIDNKKLRTGIGESPAASDQNENRA